MVQAHRHAGDDRTAEGLVADAAGYAQAVRQN
jgi:hypothetical protein